MIFCRHCLLILLPCPIFIVFTGHRFGGVAASGHHRGRTAARDGQSKDARRLPQPRLQRHAQRISSHRERTVSLTCFVLTPLSQLTPLSRPLSCSLSVPFAAAAGGRDPRGTGAAEGDRRSRVSNTQRAAMNDCSKRQGAGLSQQRVHRAEFPNRLTLTRGDRFSFLCLSFPLHCPALCLCHCSNVHRLLTEEMRIV